MNVLRLFRCYSSREISELISIQSKSSAKQVCHTALVTGATQEISGVCIKYLLQNGLSNLIITDIHANEGKDLAFALNRKYRDAKICFIRADLMKETHVHDMFRSIEYDFGQCDLIINSAVVYDEMAPIKMVDVNIGVLTNVTNFAIEHMSKDNGGKGGTIINMSSILGLEELAHTPMFTATKSYVIGLTRSYGMPYHYQHSGIRFMALCPGMTVEELKRFNEQARRELAKFGRQKIGVVGDCLMEMIKYGGNGSLWTAERGCIYENNLPYKLFTKKETYNISEDEQIEALP